MQRKSVVGTRSSFLWLLILVMVIVLIGAAVAALVILPQRQASQAEQARLAEVERHYQAGVAFQRMDDWSSAESEYKQVILAEAGYKEVQARLAEVKGRSSAIQATTTAAAVAQRGQATTEAWATAAAAPTATAQALEARYQKGLGFMNLKRWEEAKMELELVFSTDPGFRDVQAKLKDIQQALDNLRSLTPTALPITPTSIPPTTTPPTREPATATPAPTMVELDVQAKRGWQSSGLSLKVGQSVTIAASGRWSHGPDGSPQPYYGPEGYDKADSKALLPSARVGALIGRIGNGTPFVVGVGVSFVASGVGYLDLSINDVPNYFDDNDGSVRARIMVR